MLLVDSDLDEVNARKAIANLTGLFHAENCQNFTETVSPNDPLAYAIKKKTNAHRFLFQFTTDDVKAINEFNRLVVINKAVLRHLLINLEHNYAYKTLVNPKKIKIAEFRQQKFQQYLANKAKEAEAAESAAILGSNVVEAKMRKVRDYKGLDQQPVKSEQSQSDNKDTTEPSKSEKEQS